MPRRASRKPAPVVRSSDHADAERRLAGFLARYSPEVQALAAEALQWMRARLPHAFQFVYDNYNALAIGFGPTERPSDAAFSIAVYPRWVSVFLLQGAKQKLADPKGLLRGGGNAVRHVRLDGPGMLHEPALGRLIDQSLRQAKVPYTPQTDGRLIIASVSARQRPRRP